WCGEPYVYRFDRSKIKRGKRPTHDQIQIVIEEDRRRLLEAAGLPCETQGALATRLDVSARYVRRPYARALDSVTAEEPRDPTLAAAIISARLDDPELVKKTTGRRDPKLLPPAASKRAQYVRSVKLQLQAQPSELSKKLDAQRKALANRGLQI